MSLFETEETNKFTFEAFAAHQFYTDVNRILVHAAVERIVERWKQASQKGAKITIVDMACGTGAISRLIAEEMAQYGLLTHTYIIGVDPSAEAVRLAHKAMQEAYPGIQADFLQGEVTDLSRHVQEADGVFFCNAIHLVPDKRDAFCKLR